MKNLLDETFTPFGWKRIHQIMNLGHAIWHINKYLGGEFMKVKNVRKVTSKEDESRQETAQIYRSLLVKLQADRKCKAKLHK